MQARYLTIMEATSPEGDKVPFIRIFGEQLEEMGFKVGKSVRLEITPGRIVVTPDFQRDRLIEQKSRQLHSLFKELQGLHSNLFELDGYEAEVKDSRQRHKSSQKVLVG